MPELLGLSTEPITAKGRAGSMVNWVYYLRKRHTPKNARARRGVRLWILRYSYIMIQLLEQALLNLHRTEAEANAYIIEVPGVRPLEPMK